MDCRESAESDDANRSTGSSEPRHPAGETNQQQDGCDEQRDGGQSDADVDGMQGGVPSLHRDTKPSCQRLSGLWPTETLTTQNHSALGEQGIELLVALVDPDSPSRSR